MASLNKSFFYGICFASVTWCICFYLYYQLNKSQKLAESSLTPNYLISNSVLDAFDENANKKPLKSHVPDFWSKQKLQPVVINEIGMVKTAQEQQLKDLGYKTHAYNVLVSEQLGLSRQIPDTRKKLCKDIKYKTNELPCASVIICFYNEHNSTLLRSVQSILDRTPDNLLKEILLVNDFSDLEHLHDDVTKYIKSLNSKKVKLLQTERREGLIRARMFGSKQATGEVLVFLDSHIEVNQGWIEPLLEKIHEDKKNVVMPVIDVINPDTFAYSSSPLVRGGFNWGLHFKWENLPKGTLAKDEDFIKGIKSPTMAGGLFAMDRQYFTDLGEYDAGMNIWGGENLEISFRIWMCGGTLELIPCSRVGHVFRQRRPYGSPDGQDTLLHNSLRVAHVWMGKYKDHFLKQRKDTYAVNFGDISSRIQLKRDLKCHDFDWYLKNVYPELSLPDDDEAHLKKKQAALEQDVFQPWHMRKRNYVKQFQLRLAETNLCTQSSKDTKTKGSLLELRPCIRGKQQMWYQTDRNELVLAQLLCLEAHNPEPHLYKCHEMGGNQEWKHKGEKHSPVYNLATGTCLSVRKAKVGARILMTLCSEETLNKWDLIES